MLFPGKEVSGYEVLTAHQDVSDPTVGMFLARHMETGEFRVGYTSDDLGAIWSMTTGETFDSYVDAAHFYTRALLDEAFEYESERDIARQAQYA